MKKLLFTVIALNIITMTLVLTNVNENVYVNIYKLIAFTIYTYTIVLAIKELYTKSSEIVIIPTHFNPDVCRKCGYKRCICHLYPPPPDKPKMSDPLTIEILLEDFRKNS